MTLETKVSLLGIPNPFDGKREIIVPCACIRKYVRKVTSLAGVNGTTWVTIGDDTFQIGDVELTERAAKHELCHVTQRDKFVKALKSSYLGTAAFWALYAFNHWRWGYWKNPFELEARKAEVL